MTCLTHCPMLAHTYLRHFTASPGRMGSQNRPAQVASSSEVVPMMSTVDPHIGIGAQHSLATKQGPSTPTSRHNQHRVLPQRTISNFT